ncbi:MAG: CpsD/CapB family tyrosine-protein kinase [Candidatus Omnitrophota bacterium]
MFARFIAKIKDKSGIDARVVSYYSPGSVLAEQYRNIRTYISSLNGGILCRSLCISSANSGEGKSITCVNLAVAMAEDKEKKIVIVNSDFRFGSLESLLNIKAEKGLSDYLNNQAALNEVLVPTEIENLKILPAGNIPENPAEIFASQKLKELVVDLEKNYNYIIFDTPAIIPFAEGKILGPCVDGVLLVVQAGKTRREVVWRIEEELKSVRAKILGVVLTNVEYYIPEYIHRHL